MDLDLVHVIKQEKKAEEVELEVSQESSGIQMQEKADQRAKAKFAMLEWQRKSKQSKYKLARDAVNMTTKVTVKYVFVLQLIGFIGMASNVLFQSIFSLSVPIMSTDEDLRKSESTIEKLLAISAVMIYSLVMLPAVLDQVYDAVADSFSGDDMCLRLIHGTPLLRYFYNQFNKTLSKWLKKPKPEAVLTRGQFVQFLLSVPSLIFGIILSGSLGGPLSAVLTIALAIGSFLVFVHLVLKFMYMIAGISSFGGLIVDIPAVWNGLLVPKKKTPAWVPARKDPADAKLKALAAADQTALLSPTGKQLERKPRKELSLWWKLWMKPFVKTDDAGGESVGNLIFPRIMCFVAVFFFIFLGVTSFFIPIEVATGKWSVQRLKTRKFKGYLKFASGMIFAIIVCCVYLLTLSVYVEQFSVSAAIAVFLFLMLSQPIVFATYRKFQDDGYSIRKFSREAGLPIFMLFLCLAVIGVLFVVLLQIQEKPESTDTTNALAFKDRYAAAMSLTPGEEAFDTDKYSLCDSDWEGKDIVDIALMADLSYRQDPEDFDAMFDLYLDNTTWSVAGKNNETDIVKFYHLRREGPAPGDPIYNIISVRGTSSAADMVQDADLYMEVALIQLFSLAFPFIFIMPENFIQYAVLSMSILEVKSTTEQRKYYQNVESYVTDNFGTGLSFGNEPLMFTGHSLGGAIAKIVAIRTNHTATVFSAPGLILSRRKFDLDRKALSRSVTNVKPRADIVSKIDEYGGLVQRIECDQGFGLLACHFLKNTICELWRGCGKKSDQSFIEVTHCNPPAA